MESMNLWWHSIHWAWIISGSLTFLGLTVLFPLIATGISPFMPKLRKQTRALIQDAVAVSDIEILVPAYNEEDTIEKTVASIRASVTRLLTIHPELKVSIRIGLDGPTDSTPKIAQRLAANDSLITVYDRGANRGKWKTIEEMIMHSSSKWVAMVDCGTIWPEDLLIRTHERMLDGHWVGIGPGYQQTLSSPLEKLIWWLERFLKAIENFGGGTITLHGATIFFRTAVVQQVIREIMYRPWLNDDVVLSIAIRTWGRTFYFGSALTVGDIGVRSGRGEYNRRKRMVLGNLEWIRDLFPKLWIGSWDVGVLSLRRVFRVFWVWCLILTAVQFQLGLQLPLFLVLPLLVFLSAGFIANRRLREAMLAGLLSPLWIFKKTRVQWS